MNSQDGSHVSSGRRVGALLILVQDRKHSAQPTYSADGPGLRKYPNYPGPVLSIPMSCRSLIPRVVYARAVEAHLHCKNAAHILRKPWRALSLRALKYIALMASYVACGHCSLRHQLQS